MTTRKPNLFLVGAMRSGTTALHELLGGHPQIFMTEFKEPAYFTDPAELAADSRIIAEAGYAGDLTRYLSLFAAVTNEVHVGESSTHYTKMPRITEVPARIAGMAPDARILYLVRDPVQRALSHYRFAVNRKTERASSLQAVRDDPFYVSVSNYAFQIRPYFEVFGPDRVRVIVLEELIERPDLEMSALSTWLGIKPFEDPRLPLRNAGPTRLVMARGPEMLHRVGRTSNYQGMARRWLPDPVRGLARRILSRSVGSEGNADCEAISYLRTVLGPTVEDLADLTGRNYEAWSTPTGSAPGVSPPNDD